MNRKAIAVLTGFFALFEFSASARLRLQDGEYCFCNKSTNRVSVTRVLADGKELVRGGTLNPYQRKSVSDLDMFPYTLPQFFQVEYQDSTGTTYTNKLETSWIKQKSAKDGTIYFVYTPEKKFVLKIYLRSNKDDTGMRLDGLLLPDEENPGFKSYKELVRASIDGNAQRVRELLTNGVAYTWPNEPVGLTPLGWSVRWNRIEAFEALIGQMPKDFYPFEYYWCIQIAAQDGEVEILKRLLQSPLASEIPKSQLQQIFYHACYNPNPQNIESVKMLLDHFKVGVDFKTGDFGHTLLFVAIDSGDIKLIQWLLAQGADPNAKLQNGDTPLKYARSDAIRKVLIDAGAK